MDLPPAAWWSIAAGVTVAAELTTGTYYLLMIALGLMAAALVALFGTTVSVQLMAAAVIGGGATAAWHAWRLRQPRSKPARENPDVNLDIGDRVQVRSWSADGTARVQHRGSPWRARLAPGAVAAAGAHRIVAIDANSLILMPLDEPAPAGR
jgi:membrane protein implicated in regulation of membrane protease activity